MAGTLKLQTGPILLWLPSHAETEWLDVTSPAVSYLFEPITLNSQCRLHDVLRLGMVEYGMLFDALAESGACCLRQNVSPSPPVSVRMRGSRYTAIWLSNQTS